MYSMGETESYAFGPQTAEVCCSRVRQTVYGPSLGNKVKLQSLYYWYCITFCGYFQDKHLNYELKGENNNYMERIHMDELFAEWLF